MEADLIEVPSEDVPPREVIFIDKLEGYLLFMKEEGDCVFYYEKAELETKGQVLIFVLDVSLVNGDGFGLLLGGGSP